MLTRKTLSLIALVLALAATLAGVNHSDTPPPTANELVGLVVGIADGDTIEMLIDQKTERIRLRGIDCPEKAQPFGTRAKQFTAELSFKKMVRVKTFGKDHYQRWLGEVFLEDGRNLNHELLRAGLAWWYRQYSKDENLQRLEAQARQEGLGLWADAKPIPPWKFRRKKTNRRSKENHDSQSYRESPSPP